MMAYDLLKSTYKPESDFCSGISYLLWQYYPWTLVFA